MDLLEQSMVVGARHPWEIARATFVARLLEEFGSGESRLLDVGSGDGWLAATLVEGQPALSATCWDINYSPESIEMLERQHPNIEFTATEPQGNFDLVTVLDVLEHVEHDKAFAASVVQDNLAPGGLLIVTVPAYQAFYTSHDRALKHFRRYSPRECRGLLESQGIEILADGGLFSSLLPIRAARAAAERLSPPDEVDPRTTGVGEWSMNDRLSQLCVNVLNADARLSMWLARRRLRMSGLSYWAVGRLPA